MTEERRKPGARGDERDRFAVLRSGTSQLARDTAMDEEEQGTKNTVKPTSCKT
jgi:hypothetical protein